MLTLLWMLWINLVKSSVWFKQEVLVPSTTCLLTPPGHLQPFGYHAQPLPDMDTIPNNISTQQFNQLYIKPHGYKPGVFRGLQGNAKSTQLWTDIYLNQTYGHFKVLTEVKHENRKRYGKKLNKLSKFLTEYNTTNQYIVTVLPDDMRHDVVMPELLQCGTFSQNLLELNFWMASGNTASQVHYDADHNIHCLIAGKKTFFMMHPNQYHKFRMERLEYTGSNYCPYTNQNMVDLLEEPELSDLEYQWTTLNAGDCIFLPSQYMHQVRSYGRSISVTILWDPTIPFSKSSIGNCTTDPIAPLSNYNVAWTHKANDIFFDVGYATPYIMRNELVELYNEWLDEIRKDGENSTGWTYVEFINLMFTQLRWELPRCKYTETWVALIGYGLDTNKDGVVCLTELKTSSDEAMKAVSHFIDAPNLDSEDYDFCEKKFYYIPPEVLTPKEITEIETIGSVVKWFSTKGYSANSESSLSYLFARFLNSVLNFRTGTEV